MTGGEAQASFACYPVLNRPRTRTRPWPRSWGPLLYNTQRITLPPSARPARSQAMPGVPSHPKYLQLGNAGMLLQASSRKERLGELRALLLFQIFLPIIPCALEALSFSANPVLGCLPLPQATSSYSPSLLLPSDLIISLCINFADLTQNYGTFSSPNWFEKYPR